MKKKILMLLFGGLVMMPTTMLAQTDGDDDDNDKPGVWRSPARLPRAYINYDEASGFACVHFLSTVNNTVIIIYLNGIEIDCQLVEAVEGMQIPLYLPAYGCGEFTIKVKSGSTLIATNYITL
jgi:hypothetical protein